MSDKKNKDNRKEDTKSKKNMKKNSGNASKYRAKDISTQLYRLWCA